MLWLWTEHDAEPGRGGYGKGCAFANYFCSDAPCLPSRAALISGMFGIRNGAVGHGGTAADRRLTGADRDFQDEADLQNLTHVFRRAGLHTVSFSTFAERHSSYWFQAGFHEVYNVGKCGNECADEVVPMALDWLERNRNRSDWYMHLHLWDPPTRPIERRWTLVIPLRRIRCQNGSPRRCYRPIFIIRVLIASAKSICLPIKKIRLFPGIRAALTICRACAG